MQTRRIGPLEVGAIGFGCMSLSHAYGTPPAPEIAERVLLKAVNFGVTLFDTAALYGFGANESLLGRVLAPHRARLVIASKCGLTGVNGVRVIDGRPETLRRTCEESLQRLRTDVIDLYYLHRWDRKVPIEESVGALADLVRAGKVRALGLSEVSADLLRRAHAVHPISALQNEYSLWSRNPEIAALAACRELGVSLVAFSPGARGFLSGRLRDVGALEAKDLRRNMPRFQPEAFAANLALLEPFAALAAEAGCTPVQLALAWLLAQDERIVPIPGTTNVDHLIENVGAAALELDASLLARVGATINPRTVTGARYAAATLAEIDTEEFAP